MNLEQASMKLTRTGKSPGKRNEFSSQRHQFLPDGINLKNYLIFFKVNLRKYWIFIKVNLRKYLI